MKLFLASLLLFNLTISAQIYKTNEPFAHTYSIVARDSATGQMAVGVQSHWFGVGTLVAWGESGVGVVATQSFVNKSFGIRGLAHLKNGLTAQQALDSLLATDNAKEVRQVAIIDGTGNVASHTGKSCIDYATHIQGKNYSVQSNMMLNSNVSIAMSKAFEKSANEPLAERVLQALKAAEAAGGDIRGSQSAAIIVVGGTKSNEPWNDKIVDLRIDDHAQPIKEMERLLKVHRAYEHMNNGDLYIEQNKMDSAKIAYQAAQKMFPKNEEMQYWYGITLANNNKINEAKAVLRKVYDKNKNWIELTKRLPKVGMLTVSSADLKTLTQ